MSRTGMDAGRRALCGLAVVALAGCARPRAPQYAQPDLRQASTATAPKPADASVPPKPAPAACVPAERAAALHRRLASEAKDAFAFRKATPLLVDRWPAPTAVLVFTYESRALPTGMVAHEIRGPDWKIAVSPLGAKAAVTPLPAPAVLGRQRQRVSDGDLPARLAAAEEALIEAVAGCAAVTCEQLAPYRDWVDAHPTIARHLAGLPGVAIPCAPP